MCGDMLFCISFIRWTVSGFPNPQQFQLTEAKEALDMGNENPPAAHPVVLIESSFALQLYPERKHLVGAD